MSEAKVIAQVLNLPQCDADRDRPYANDVENQDKRCKRVSKFSINGKNYCKSHAQQLALDIMIRGK